MKVAVTVQLEAAPPTHTQNKGLKKNLNLKSTDKFHAVFILLAIQPEVYSAAAWIPEKQKSNKNRKWENKKN